jgi:hypothetical protein
MAEVFKLDFEAFPFVETYGKGLGSLGNAPTQDTGRAKFDGSASPSILYAISGVAGGGNNVDLSDSGAGKDFTLTLTDVSGESVPSTNAPIFLQGNGASGESLALMYSTATSNFIVAKLINSALNGFKVFPYAWPGMTGSKTIVLSRASNVYSVSVDGTPLTATADSLDGVSITYADSDNTMFGVLDISSGGYINYIGNITLSITVIVSKKVMIKK